jgi:hypothetical protein
MTIPSLYQKIKRDQLAVARYARGFLLWFAGIAGQVVSVGWDAASQWHTRDWLGRLGIASILGIGGLITAGQKNVPMVDANTGAAVVPAAPPPEPSPPVPDPVVPEPVRVAERPAAQTPPAPPETSL